MARITRRNIGILIVATCSLVAPPAASAAAPNATPTPFVTSPIPAFGTNADLESVAALSKSDAWAVGATIEHWNGKSWVEVPGGVVGMNSHDEPLNSVASVPGTEPAHVWAVGSLETDQDVVLPRIENWNGKKWSLSQAPNLPDVTLTGVAAVSTTDAWAVGSSNQNAPPEPAILHWNGGKWKQSTTPTLPNGGELMAISANGPNSVWVVGWYHNTPNTEDTLVEWWNGHKWTIMPSPSPSATDNELLSITSVPGGSPWAVGYEAGPSGNVPLTERLEGDTWVAVPAQLPNTPASLNGVAERGNDDAWADGVQGALGNTSLTEHWNGTSWKIVRSPNQSNGANRLISVAHVPGTDFFYTVGGLAEQWNGSKWLTTPTVNVGENNDVEALALTDVGGKPQAWVAGNSGGPGERDLVWHWNGKTWAIIVLPGPGDYVTSVGAAPNSDVFVGGSYYSADNVPSVKAWNGKSWSRLPSPAPPNSNGDVSSLDALSAKDVWATGDYETTGTQIPLLARWNGVTWTSVTTTCPAQPEDVYTYGISAVSDTNVWAAGYERTPQGDRALLLHWDGAQCTIDVEQNSHAMDDYLYAVLAKASGAVWAVGTRSNNDTEPCLTERNSGVTWTIAKAPNPGGLCEFRGLASAGGAELWAVGASQLKSELPLIEWWDGSAWHVNHSAALNHPGAYLRSAAGTADGHTVLAVGESSNRFGVELPFAVARITG